MSIFEVLFFLFFQFLFGGFCFLCGAAFIFNHHREAIRHGIAEAVRESTKPSSDNLTNGGGR